MLPRSRILLYEFATGGGLADQPEPERSPWFAEGQAMLRALAADLAAIAGCEVRAMCDARLKLDLPGCQIVPVEGQAGDLELLAAQASTADWTIVIAPETGGLLESRARAVLAGGGKLLGPGPDLIALCGDKQRLAEHLAAAGVPVPPGYELVQREGEREGEAPSEPEFTLDAIATTARQEPRPPENARPPKNAAILGEACFPAVLKPRDGAGSEGVRIVPDAASLPAAAERPGAWRLERYQPGAAASVACLQGPGGTRLLEPCRQRLLRDGGRLRYAGGHLPLSARLRERASSLARRAIAALPCWHGYLGIDMVLGPQADGSGDVVIEINPRLTTSYVGLRLAAHTNLAEAMLDLAESRCSEIEFSTEHVYFSATGLVWRGGRQEMLPEAV
ncbi:MAG TPA: ATP-grasp domain-containing protein [Pirellulales bacterium]|nr:ATP-grasp domain-containing protein [Pirellulales bacterium]